MTKLERIQESVEALSDKELHRLGEWLDELRAQRWDRQIKEDAEAGRLDQLADQALADLDAGRTRPL